MSAELQTIHQIRATIDLIMSNQGNAAVKSLMRLLDRLIDEHAARLGLTDEKRRGLWELASSAHVC